LLPDPPVPIDELLKTIVCKKDSAALTRIADWTTHITPGAPFAGTKATITSPVSSNGIYVVCARAGANDEVKVDSFAIVTDLRAILKIDAGNALILDNRFVVSDEVLQAGTQRVRISMQGKGTLYWSANLSYFDESERIKAQANAISVQRRYF